MVELLACTGAFRKPLNRLTCGVRSCADLWPVPPPLIDGVKPEFGGKVRQFLSREHNKRCLRQLFAGVARCPHLRYQTDECFHSRPL